jgi:hypothetical protein
MFKKSIILSLVALLVCYLADAKRQYHYTPADPYKDPKQIHNKNRKSNSVEW